MSIPTEGIEIKKNTNVFLEEEDDDGFSSQRSMGEIIIDQIQQQQTQSTRLENDNPILKLEPVNQIIKKTYSLEPDFINGWSPKTKLPRPIPLSFRDYHFDELLEHYLKYTPKDIAQQVQLCFLGARYRTTYFAWFQRDFDFPYKYMDAPKKIVITDRFLSGQHWDTSSSDYLKFDSFFESANLDCAFKVGESEYDLYMRVDSNTHGHLHWFNFKISGLQPNRRYKLNICNFRKGKSLYSRGMRPYYHSRKESLHQKTEWAQLKTPSKYHKKLCKTEKLLKFESEHGNYVLSFGVETAYTDDVIQLAYCIPYTYSYLLERLDGLKSRHQDQGFFRLSTLCKTLGGLEIPEITITEGVNQQEQRTKDNFALKNRKVIFITGRCHPGETNGSWMVDGLLQFLCGSSEAAQFLRRHCIIKVIPMVNPDGVVLGNYRTGLSGRDFNREFVCPDKQIFPQIRGLLSLLIKYRRVYKKDAFMYLDFHGHSIKKNVFAYGPEYSIMHHNYYESKMIPKLIANRTQMFRYYSCIFKISTHKETTGRAVCFRNLEIPFTYTIEASNGSFYNRESQENCDFDGSKWRTVGEEVLKGVHDYLAILMEYQRVRQQKVRERMRLKSQINKKMAGFSSSGFTRKTRINSTFTALCDRRTKKSANLFDCNQGLNLAELIKDQTLKPQGLSRCMEQIVRESSNQALQHKSDDAISEGKSDSESSCDNMNEQECLQLFSQLKHTKEDKKSKKKPQKMLSIVAKGIKQMNIGERQPEFQYNELSCIRKCSNKEAVNRKYFFNRKNSLYSTPSVRREDGNRPAANVRNFSFSLKPTSIKYTEPPSPTPCKANDKKMDLNAQKVANQADCNGLATKVSLFTPYQYSENFRKSFISVQQEVLRHENQNRYRVALNRLISQRRPKPSYVIQNSPLSRLRTQQ